jgi:hypothetical protein
MDYKHWSDFLTEEEFKKWEVEALVAYLIMADRDDYDYFDEFDNIFVNSYDSFRSFINSSFSWSETKDGHGYWRTISNREN